MSAATQFFLFCFLQALASDKSCFERFCLPHAANTDPAVIFLFPVLGPFLSRTCSSQLTRNLTNTQLSCYSRSVCTRKTTSLENMDSTRGLLLSLLFALFVARAVARKGTWDGKIVMPTEEEGDDTNKGVRWAVLIAGSAGYGNYRHQVVII